ncbi:arylamine N-acetyltransferase family protein [Paenibacillus mucilaginosus]|uniref:arylamine N-acetyltransferase family protein n=1 Tax=Paenibacillus mucilaginosus TaxID=61624 RepID=UPI003D2141A2
MSNVNAPFRARIGLLDDGPLTFDQLSTVLERTAFAVPFENFAIIESRTQTISKEQLLDKITVQGEGGLCYELNTLFYFFMLDNGLDARLVSGVVYNHEKQRYPATGRTHVTILLRHENRTYLIDTGFGSNLPLRPLPLSGEPVSSSNGDFRIVPAYGEHAELGDYVLEMKLKHKHSEWMTGYVFDTAKTITDDTELNAIQRIIAEHSDSPFNKKPLVTKVTERGTITLTPSFFTEWCDGVMTKTPVDESSYRELLWRYFGMPRPR